MKPTFLFVSSFAALLSTTVAQSEPEANCTIFTSNGLPGYLQNYTSSVRISAARSCPERDNDTHACPIVADGDWQNFWYWNISDTLRETPATRPNDNFFYTLILDSVNGSLAGVAWPERAVASIDTTEKLFPGSSGYINFTPYVRCFEGTLSNCTGGPEDGLGVQACAPVYHLVDEEMTGFPVFDGVNEIVEIPEANVSQYLDPFSGQSRGGAGQAAGHISNIMIGAALIAGLVASLL